MNIHTMECQLKIKQNELPIVIQYLELLSKRVLDERRQTQNSMVLFVQISRSSEIDLWLLTSEQFPVGWDENRRNSDKKG